MSNRVNLTEKQQAVLQRLAEAGELTADNVVKEASKKRNPLHPLFDWNAKLASHHWWTQQARVMIASVRVQIQINSHAVECVAYVRDPRLPASEQGYVDVGTTLMSDKSLAIAAVEYEAARAAAYLARTRALALALGLEDRVDELIERLSLLRDDLVAMQEAA